MIKDSHKKYEKEADGMNSLIKAGAIMALLTITACTNAINGQDDDGFGSSGTGGTTGDTTSGLISDQTSPAYFQQAIGDRVLFLVDQSSLTDEAQAILAAQATWLINNPVYSVVIEGHADEQGTREYNLALGARRANSAKEYLMSRGVNADRLKTVSFGKERPIEICSEESCYAKNRRAVTVLSADLSG